MICALYVIAVTTLYLQQAYSYKSVQFNRYSVDSFDITADNIQSSSKLAAACIEHDKCNAFFFEEFECDLLYNTSSQWGLIKIWKQGKKLNIEEIFLQLFCIYYIRITAVKTIKY